MNIIRRNVVEGEIYWLNYCSRRNAIDKISLGHMSSRPDALGKNVKFTSTNKNSLFPSKNNLMLWYTRAIFFQGPIGREIRTIVRIRWCFAQMCCTMSLVYPSITTHRTCQFWARSEPLNMPKTIVSRQIWSACYNSIPLFRKSDGNVVLVYCPCSWQCSAANYSCNKEAPGAFSMGSVWSPTIIRPDLAHCNFHLFPRMKRR